MKILGLITEYNPFHNGHAYHIEKSRAGCQADYCIALMSGSFVQRGEPAVYDKYVRTEMALKGGADLVLEMPAAFSTASAREFASYAIALFTALGAVDDISFGSECGDMDALMPAASILLKEPEGYTPKLRDSLKAGMTFPEARQLALAAFLPAQNRDILSSPNNILGIEYCRAALELKSSLKLHTIKRMGSGYHDTSTAGSLGSATAIRKALCAGEAPDGLSSLVPPYSLELMRRETPLFLNAFSAQLNYRILQGDTCAPMENTADMTPGLAARIRKETLSFAPYEERIKSLKSRQLTHTRVSRALLHLLLGISAEDMRCYKDAGYAPYARILGFRKEAAPLLTVLKKSSSIPLLSKLADGERLLSPAAHYMLSQEIRASHLYSGVKKEMGGIFKNEYTQPIIILS